MHPLLKKLIVIYAIIFVVTMTGVILFITK